MLNARVCVCSRFNNCLNVQRCFQSFAFKVLLSHSFAFKVLLLSHSFAFKVLLSNKRRPGTGHTPYDAVHRLRRVPRVARQLGKVVCYLACFGCHGMCVAHSARQIHGHTVRMRKQCDWNVRVTRVTNVSWLTVLVHTNPHHLV